ncbi:MAG: NAD(P)H-dependent glycerol-3-phosphate dehydrogenase [Bacilli bacterium]|nr:NAD(P)H-dependent glycerol-3-phosphate dehydrogenase [Bacilli bacterium]
MNNVAIIGTGAYGLSIAIALLKKVKNIKMWVESEERAEFLNKNKKNSNILPNIEIPDSIEFSNDYEYVIKDTNVVFIAVTAKFVGPVTKELSKYNLKNKHFCILSKGIEQNTCKFVTDVFKSNIKTKNISVISGPSFAIDVANNQPIGLSIASKNKETIRIIKKVLENDRIKLRETTDIIGTELCGSIKNVIAIAAGILEGMGYQESTRSFLITESLHDIKALIYGLGGNKKTILSFAGVGDLLLTATSTKSRNYSYGVLIGKGDLEGADKYVNENTVEGYYTLKSIYTLIRRKKIKMPIINLIYQIIINKKDPSTLVDFLIKK